MKHWYRAFPAKIGCFILCIVSLCIVAASVIGAALCIDLGFYTNSKASLIEQNLGNLVRNDAYNIMDYNAENSINNYAQIYDYAPENSNLRFQLFSSDGKIVDSNISEHLSIDSKKWEYSIAYYVTADKENNAVYISFAENVGDSTESIYTFKAYLEEGLPVEDEYAFIGNIISIGFSLRYWVYVIGVIFFALSVASFSVLMCASARRPNTEDIYAGPLNRVPFDLLLAANIVLFVIGTIFFVNAYYIDDTILVVFLIVWVLLAANAALGLCVSAAARIKQKSLIKNTVIFKLLTFVWHLLKRIAGFIKKLLKSLVELLRSIPLIWRTLLGVAAFTFLDFLIFLMAYNMEEISIVFWFIKSLMIIPVILYSAIFMRKLQKGGDAIAKGDLTYKIDTNMMFWDFKRHGENLNSIADGMNFAVEERMQSERMKTELITNVSHDIKTPLTSIINYAGLIAKEEAGSKKHTEYAEVLVRKSEHLKRLLDDLVEISKANTGNLEVDLSPCDAGVLLTQAAGEFKERCQSAGLELIVNQPEKGIRIMADSRRIWRVFENLMTNACKYSLEGSRVYLSLEEKDSQALFVFRNTSKAALNISPDELMERFVRGDVSRTTEGNGLGLSIAKSLTELQKGKMDIFIDGDLFKVTLRFPII